MNRQMHRTEIAVAPTSAERASAWLQNGGIVLAGSLLVAACARVAIPLNFTPVPLTMQPFAVLVLGLLLGPRLAAATTLAYLAEGAAGLPVFAAGAMGVSGIAHLVGPTGGYLLAYPPAAWLIAWMWRGGARTFGRALASAAAGSLIILGLGALWLGVLTHAPAGVVLTQSVVPFLPGDALKVAAAAALGYGWQRVRRGTR